MNEVDIRRLTSPSSVTDAGLVIAGAVQCFPWERSSQSAYARLAADGSSSVVNIGYGLGFAHAAFEAIEGVSLELIEINPSVLARAKEESCNPSTLFHLGPWQELLPSVASSDKTIFFDAFPVAADFDYSREAFVEYIDPFLRAIRSLPWQDCYFVVFDSEPIPFPAPSRMRVQRVAATPLAAEFRSLSVTAISLYQASRLSVIASQGRA